MLNDLICEEFFILDTETTGLGSDAEIVELSLIDNKGSVIIDTLVKPINKIPLQAVDIHGITTEKALKEGMPFSEVNKLLCDALSSSDVVNLVIYNSNYDVRVYEQTCKLHNIPTLFHVISPPFIYCAMNEYAEFYGEFNESRGSFKWQSLVNACKQQNIHVHNAHRALGDCNMTLELINSVWGR